MRTRVLIFRHGDSFHKQQGIVGGMIADRGLTSLGMRQTEQLGRRLNLQPPEKPVMYSSPLPRCIQTAQQVAAHLDNLPLRIEPGLTSWRVPPEVDGLPTAQFQRDYRAEGGGIFRPFETLSESYAELVIRNSRTLIELAQRHRGHSLLLFAHAETVGASLVAFGNLPLLRNFELQVDNASITEWFSDADPSAWPPPFLPWTLVRLNDSAHLG